MSNSVPTSLIISGNVYDHQPLFAQSGDVRLFPGPSKTPFIDGRIFDGRQWRELDLDSLGVTNRVFVERVDIGPLMRIIASKVQQHRGHPVHYERQGTSRKSRYIFRGISIGTFLK